MIRNVIYSLFIALPFLAVSQNIELGVPIGYSDAILFMKVGPNDDFLITSSHESPEYKVWDIESGKLIRTIPYSGRYVDRLTPDGRYIISPGSTGHYYRTDLVNGNVDSTLVDTLEYSVMHTNNAGTQAITAWYWLLMVKPLFSDEPAFDLYGDGAREIWDLKISADDKLMVTTDFDGQSFDIWNLEKQKQDHAYLGTGSKIMEFEFSVDHKFLFTAHADSTVCIWDTKKGKLVGRTKSLGAKIDHMDISSGDQHLVATFDDLFLFDAKGNTKRIYSSDLGYNSAKFTPTGNQIFIYPRETGDAQLYDIASKSTSCSFEIVVNKDDIYQQSRIIGSPQFTADGKHLIGTYFNRVYMWSTTTGKLERVFEGSSTPQYHSEINPKANLFFTEYQCFDEFDQIMNSRTDFWNFKTGKPVHTFDTDDNEFHNVGFSKASDELCIVSWSSLGYDAEIFDPESKKLISKFTTHSSFRELKQDTTGNWLLGTYYLNASNPDTVYSLSSADHYIWDSKMSNDGKYIATNGTDNEILIWSAKTGAVRRVVKTEGRPNHFEFSHDSKLLIYSERYSDRIILYDIIAAKELENIVIDPIWHNGYIFIVNPKNPELFVKPSYGAPLLFNYQTLEISDIFSSHLSMDFYYEFHFSPDGRHLFVAQGNDIYVWETENWSLKYKLRGHSGKVNSLHLSHTSDNYLISSSHDGSNIIWDLTTGKQLIRHFYFDNDPEQWVHVSPTGLFDASPEAMEKMYWVKGMEIIEFSQLKNRYWLPRLWEKVLNGEELPSVDGIGNIRLQPEVNLGEVKNGVLPITLTKRDGGYGEVAIFINGKEVSRDIRGDEIDTTKATQTLNFSIKDHPYLVNGNNTITVKASSADGALQGRGVSTESYFEMQEVVPHFYGVVIGVNEYANDDINLKFPVKDATSIAQALEIGAENLFDKNGEDLSSVYVITSESEVKPKKENIRSVFQSIAAEANAEDVIVVYLSGHGISWGSGDEGDFFFLTADATAANKNAYDDASLRTARTISTSEIVEWLKEIPALKQVMIIDACGSGKAVDNLLAARDVEASQTKAIDRMKDRTGMYVISGCSADAVSYEASQYGQGLLTYSILQAMKGAALKENKYVDVLTIMNHARETVPKLATGIGGVQTPQLLTPKGGSFDIGMLNDTDKASIPLSSEKHVVIRSMLLDKTKFRDVLGISSLLNDALSNACIDNDECNFVFFDTDNYSGAYQLTGGYTTADGTINLDLVLVKDQEEQQQSFSANTPEELIDEIVNYIRTL